MDATSSTTFYNCHGRQDCLNPCTATREISKSSEEDTVKQITLTATFQMILMMVLNKTMRMEVFLRTQFRIIWMLRNKDKEIREIIIVFVLWIFQSHPSVSYIISDFLIEPNIAYHISYDNHSKSQFS